ncbi:MAG TPA: N-acetylmuramoyl-L-alanine amidase [Candidatus Eremiobacteraceae bacterium]|nr:N-acetylmuramoyl-L-alanine amidase [Candidatus Eremiobacteraceae bacterium]
MAWLDGHTRDKEGSWAAIAMATIPTKTTIDQSALDKTGIDKTATDGDARMAGTRLPAWPPGPNSSGPSQDDSRKDVLRKARELRPSGVDALQALLAFSALHQQVRNRRALASRLHGFETIAATAEFDAPEQFVLDEVLQMVAERAIAITGADGLGIALAENNEIVLRASAGTIKPDVGARIQRDSAFSGACFRMAQIIRCDDTETDDRVNLYACRQLGARSMVAVPLCGRRRVIGLLEAFSAEPYGFNDSDVVSLELLAELILGALKPEDEERFAESAQVAVAGLITPADAALTQTTEPPSVEKVASAAPPAPEIKHEVDVASVNSAVAIAAPASVDKREPDAEDLDLKKLDLKKQETETLDAAPNPTEPNPAPIAHHPGVVEVLVLVVIFALVAGGFWWKLKNAQMGKALVQPPKVITKSEASARQSSSSVSPTSVKPYSTSPPTTNVDAGSKPGSLNSGINSNEVNAPATTGNATPQELSKMPRITGIRHWSSADSSTVVLDLEDQVQYEAHRLSGPDRIYFDLHDTSLAPELEGQTIEIGDSLLARVRVAQPVSGLTRLVLETKGNSNYSVSLEPNPYRLVVQVRKPGADPKAQINLFPGAEGDRGKLFAIVVPPPTREDLQLRARVPKMRIVVDAGHGGWDLGTVGRRGLLEKDLVLEIAQRLAKLLETRLGAKVILTRNDDNYIPLDERAGMANQAQADLFVSVHANYSDLPSARGVETYYTNFFSSPNAKDLESRDQETRDQTHGAATAAVLSPAELHDKIEQSRRLAASVQRSLYGTLSVQNPGLRDRGVKEASYVVLTETAMPGILAEVSFVSSPADEQKLRSDGYREQIAEALYKGIARYAANSRGVKMASAAK